MNAYILEIDWDIDVALRHGLPRFVGPFKDQNEAAEWGRLNIPNGSWNAAPLARPYAEVTR